jgi:hypothetical protein
MTQNISGRINIITFRYLFAVGSSKPFYDQNSANKTVLI